MFLQIGQGPTPAPIVCDNNIQFSCLNNGVKECLPNSWKCDGYPDCQDGTDEVGCPPLTTETTLTTAEQINCAANEVSVFLKFSISICRPILV